jgi:hypothetical protein
LIRQGKAENGSPSGALFLQQIACLDQSPGCFCYMIGSDPGNLANALPRRPCRAGFMIAVGFDCGVNDPVVRRQTTVRQDG